MAKRTTQYKVRDLSLAKQGMLNIEYAEMQMGALMLLKRQLGKKRPLKGLRIGMALHVTKETAALVRAFVHAGAKVAIASCNPLSTQDDVAAALAKQGVNVFAWKGESKQAYYENLHKVLDYKPDVTVDDGGDLVSLVHSVRHELLDKLKVGTEETTTGVLRLRAMERAGKLRYPIIAVNDNPTKYLFDNVYGTGQSTIDGLLRATNTLLAGKTFVVCGYGNCGKGLARRASGMGANVVVTEVEPLHALQAAMDGYRVMKMSDAAKIGDVFVTVTGNKHVITIKHMQNMKDGAILANAGHFDVEIDVKGLRKLATRKRRIRPHLEEFTLPNGKRLFLCSEGRLVNLAAAEGHPSTVMSLSFCGQLLAVHYGITHKLEPRVHTLPSYLDRKIATLQLASMGIKIDRLSKAQREYLSSWKEGT
jgi:adenosylhomocysteinase